MIFFRFVQKITFLERIFSLHRVQNRIWKTLKELFFGKKKTMFSSVMENLTMLANNNLVNP